MRIDHNTAPNYRSYGTFLRKIESKESAAATSKANPFGGHWKQPSRRCPRGDGFPISPAKDRLQSIGLKRQEGGDYIQLDDVYPLFIRLVSMTMTAPTDLFDGSGLSPHHDIMPHAVDCKKLVGIGTFTLH
jgi:hypothetical protein